MLTAGVTAAAPAYADSGSHTVYVSTGSANQYLQFCQSASTCNEQQPGTLNVQFGRTGTVQWVQGQPALGVFYEIINGTAVDGTDFNTPMTGEAIIPVGQWVGNPLVILLVNERGQALWPDLRSGSRNRAGTAQACLGPDDRRDGC